MPNIKLVYNTCFFVEIEKQVALVKQEPLEQTAEKEQEDIPFWSIVLSVIQASFGVQNKKNRERDFKQGKVLPFVVAAIIFTSVFVLSLVFIVKLVLS